MLLSEVTKADRVINIGQRLEIFVESDEEKYSSKIEDITEKELVVTMPIDKKRRPIIPQKGANLYILAIGDNCKYRFFSTYIDKEKREFPIWRISRPETVERHQSREHVRVAHRLPIFVQVMDKNGGFLPIEKLYTTDLSGGGIAFYYQRNLEEGSQVILEMNNLPQIGTLRLMAVVKRSVKRELPTGENIYHIGVHFMDIKPNIRNKLIHYLFEIQRQFIFKGFE